jgi:hypothetical protein
MTANSAVPKNINGRLPKGSTEPQVLKQISFNNGSLD